MNRIITGEMFVFLLIAGAFLAASLYLGGQGEQAIDDIREFIRTGII